MNDTVRVTPLLRVTEEDPAKMRLSKRGSGLERVWAIRGAGFALTGGSRVAELAISNNLRPSEDQAPCQTPRLRNLLKGLGATP